MKLTPEQTVELANKLAKEIYPERFRILKNRLRVWLTETWIRNETKPVGREYGKCCEFCRGLNETHFCVNPICAKMSDIGCFRKKDQCVHPTPHELKLFVDIQNDYIKLITEVVDSKVAEINSSSVTNKPPSTLN